MKPAASVDRLTLVSAALAAPLAFGCLALGLMAANYDMAVFDDPAMSVSTGARGARLAHASMICDMFGYYLLLVPLIIAIHPWLASRVEARWANLVTFAGAAYVMVGACGAAILAAVWPPLIVAYEKASPSEQASIAATFRTVTNLVDRGMWNRLEVLLAAVFWVGIGSVVVRERRALGIVTQILGVGCAVDGFATIAGLPSLASIGLNVYLVLAPIWAVWMSFAIGRRPAPAPAATSTPTALPVAA